MISKKLITLVTFALLAFAALPAVANSGRVMTMSGDVKVNGQTMRKSHIVRAGDRITTGADSHVNIVMSDRSVIDIRPNTKFQLEKFSFNRKRPERGNSLMNLLRGSFRYISGLIGRTNHKNSSIRIGAATIGVRGSFATFWFDGQKAVIDVSLGKIVATLANGQTITIERKKDGEISKEKSSTVIVNKGERGIIVFSVGEGTVTENPSPDAAMEAAMAILKDPSPEAVKAAMEGLSFAERAMVVTVMVADTAALGGNSESLTLAIAVITEADPKFAPLVKAIVTALTDDCGVGGGTSGEGTGDGGTPTSSGGGGTVSPSSIP